jgi:hypothetical protein
VNRPCRVLTLVLGLACLGSLGPSAATGATAAAPHSAFIRIPGVRSAGTPARYDRVGILQIGSPRARNVLVLNPGTSAGAGYFQPLADAIVSADPGWQVWSVERRENLLEDQSEIDRAKTGHATPQALFDYYVGFLKNRSIRHHLRLIPDSEVGYARDWGMATEIGDLRQVVRRAERLGGHVVLGGHSLGGTITTAYATWDFHGRSGAAGLSGLVFIDGASRTEAISGADARQALAGLRKGSPWLSFGGIPAPFAGVFSATGALAAELAPHARSLGQDSGLIPASITPPVPVTNAGEYGYALDVHTSPAGLLAAQAHLGHLAASGNPRDWVDAGALTPLQRFAVMFSGWGLRGIDGTAWYHPLRLTLDADAVANGIRNPAQTVMAVRAIHGRDLPRRLRLLAFGAALGGRRVLDATRALAHQSNIPPGQLTLIDRHTTYAHNDPNSAAPGRNAFLRALVPFLERVGHG